MIRTSGATSPYRSISPPTAEERQGARPPAVRRATVVTAMGALCQLVAVEARVRPVQIEPLPREGGGPGRQSLCVRLWVPAFAGKREDSIQAGQSLDRLGGATRPCAPAARENA